MLDLKRAGRSDNHWLASEENFCFLKQKESEIDNLQHPKFNTGAREVGSHISVISP